ncbi:preprotein translocase subunit SecE [Candidatus Portiera aleyrodidarum]|uniref:preprotein translocase subunit SecE n=1 Tax=Candidatus Portiera aleyrodidarum TaxID=91844 RepID=UPI001C613577|nr:preprotein translocase subunit SecE [Candidatus Portiera aleyrodidarum]
MIKKNIKSEFLKWFFSIISIIFAILINSSFAISEICIIFLYSFSIYLMLITIKGKELIFLGKNAKKEIKFVFWPKKKEIIKTTIIVVFFIFILGLLIWILDTLISGLIAIIINKN